MVNDWAKPDLDSSWLLGGRNLRLTLGINQVGDQRLCG